mgnify:CR=1 FL=1
MKKRLVVFSARNFFMSHTTWRSHHQFHISCPATWTLINYTGIVRGASQKLVKMELNDIHGDDLIVYIDDIVNSLCTGRGAYDLPLPDDADYLDELHQTKEAWEQLKQQIYAVRTSRNDQNVKHQLLQDSEDFFQTTNDMVCAAESFTEQHAKRLMLLDIIMFLSVLALWVFIFITNIRKISVWKPQTDS